MVAARLGQDVTAAVINDWMSISRSAVFVLQGLILMFGKALRLTWMDVHVLHTASI